MLQGEASGPTRRAVAQAQGDSARGHFSSAEQLSSANTAPLPEAG